MLLSRLGMVSLEWKMVKQKNVLYVLLFHDARTEHNTVGLTKLKHLVPSLMNCYCVSKPK